MSKGSSRMLIDDDHNKFFSRLSSRERCQPSKQGEASFRVLYYGGAPSSIPFTWESQPGIPKHALADDPLPPLTPPPYYHQSSPRMPRKIAKSSSGILNSILPKMPSKKINNASPLFSPHSSSSSSSFSSSHSLSFTPINPGKNIISPINKNNHNYIIISNDNDDGEASSRLACRLRPYEAGEFEEAGKCSPRSTLCFGPMSMSPSMRRMKGFYYPIRSVKKVVVSMVGHGKD